MNARVIITGAASGIGAATAAALRDRDAEVIGLDLNAEGKDILRCDVRDQASVDHAVAEAIARLRGLDVLINCAGIGDPQSAGEPPGEDALRVIDVNLLGPWRVTGAAFPALRASHGRVINVASGLAHMTVPLAPAYCMSKRGLVAYSDSLRIEHGDEITVTTVYPGYIRTPIHDAAAAKGLSLEGSVPAESVEDAARTLTSAALDSAKRDVATTRLGEISYALLHITPRRLVDWAVTRQFRRGGFDGSALVTRAEE
ncbi:MAG TPA: SDR family NAD(P)-dependent oxidoreductase [Solirubrobacteraceae bacterium]|jgi:NAD(P)-dependent dehydrogenase (short-subunit alcohol dehydrogenase family)|nr:SDR family NAD(P)-dependent oxidoreductase [Solirubrobacteraceae bacterium]